jgi:hypothetical protein
MQLKPLLDLILLQLLDHFLQNRAFPILIFDPDFEISYVCSNRPRKLTPSTAPCPAFEGRISEVPLRGNPETPAFRL